MFRTLFEDIAFVDTFIRESLAGMRDVAACLCDEPFAACEGTFVSEALRKTHADAVFRTRLKDGRTLYVLLEHKSSPDPGTPLQVAEYMLGIWRSHERQEGRKTGQPVIKVIVLYHGTAPWSVPRSMTELAGTAEDPSTYVVVDLVRTLFSELSPDASARARLGILKYALVEDPSFDDIREALQTIHSRDPRVDGPGDQLYRVHLPVDPGSSREDSPGG